LPLAQVVQAVLQHLAQVALVVLVAH